MPRKRKKTVIKPRVNGVIDVTVLTDRNASVAYVKFLGPNGDGLEVTGSAKREQGDPRDQTVAIELALGRALQKMARKLITAGNRRVQAATDEQREIQERRHKRNGKAQVVKSGRLLPLDEIRENYGEEAADRARLRRQHSL